MCYKCTGSSACNDPFDKSGVGVQIVDHLAGYCFCAKVTLTDNGETTTERDCLNLSSYRANRASAGEESLSINLCNINLCNGATAAQIMLALLAVPLIFMLWQ